MLADGRISLYLEYYLGRNQWTDEETGKIKVQHHRRKESLNLYLAASPRTPAERQINKETLELAKRIRAEKEQELKNDVRGYRLAKTRKIVNREWTSICRGFRYSFISSSYVTPSPNGYIYQTGGPVPLGEARINLPTSGNYKVELKVYGFPP